MNAPLTVWLEEQNRLLRLRLARPKANLIDAPLIAALDAALAAHLAAPELTAVLIDAEGPHFSFGARVEEHLPAHCAAMLASLHRVLKRLIESPVTVLIAVQGKCLGGGLELALAGHRLFVAEDAELGQPEIRLGVFAPAASCLLPEIIGVARATDLLLSGRTIGAAEAIGLGLAQAIGAEPATAALAYFTAHLQPQSAASLRYAVRAARFDFAARVGAKLDAVERLYLEELMITRDAVEGLQAFLGKRPARWEHH
ncbi:MAG TPA: cyclohexa-1,5-dienecarbonyl-CoA hydratase [Steroidobacteraceae bacterium]|nr:cyclohexa-1,5-dienecarbonyl-CoA hydratase [Steroidobacteraceae bacterium]